MTPRHPTLRLLSAVSAKNQGIEGDRFQGNHFAR